MELPQHFLWILQNQYELAKIYNQDRRKTKLEKNRNEKHRWRINKKLKSFTNINESNRV